MSQNNEIQKLGAYLLSRGDVGQVPDPTRDRLLAIIEQVDPAVQSVDLAEDELIATVREFIEEYDLQEMKGEAERAGPDGVMGVDPITVTTVVAIWLLLQTEVKIEGSKAKGWSVKLHKKATPTDAMLKLLGFLRSSLGL